MKLAGNRNEIKKPKEDQIAGQDILDLGLGPDSDIFAEQADRETDKVEPTTSKNRNKNNYNKIPTKENPPNKKKQETKLPEQDRSLDKRRTCFFPPPNSRKANSAAEEDHERQLNVHGLPNEFMGCTVAHSRFGHYFCSNLYGSATRGPRGIKRCARIH